DNRGAHIVAPFDLAGPEGRRMKTFTCLPMLEAWFWSRGPHILCTLVPYLGGMGHVMELRHLRFFVAVAEEGSLSVAAERRLHTAQPSLSRQIRDLEYEVGAQLMIRSARGIELTAAGRVFLDHARLALAQVEAAGEAARRAAQPAKPSFALGFLTGHRSEEHTSELQSRVDLVCRLLLDKK